VHAGIDGEAVELRPPLEFVIRPRALRVRIARRHLAVTVGTARVESRAMNAETRRSAGFG
jgi:hypothetical protein